MPPVFHPMQQEGSEVQKDPPRDQTGSTQKQAKNVAPTENSTQIGAEVAAPIADGLHHLWGLRGNHAEVDFPER